MYAKKIVLEKQGLPIVFKMFFEVTSKEAVHFPGVFHHFLQNAYERSFSTQKPENLMTYSQLRKIEEERNVNPQKF